MCRWGAVERLENRTLCGDTVVSQREGAVALALVYGDE
jgi:hypothetical protein